MKISGNNIFEKIEKLKTKGLSIAQMPEVFNREGLTTKTGKSFSKATLYQVMTKYKRKMGLPLTGNTKRSKMITLQAAPEPKKRKAFLIIADLEDIKELMYG